MCLSLSVQHFIISNRWKIGSSEARVLVHEIVKVSDFPTARGFVENGHNIKKFAPAEICLESDYVFCHFLIVVA